MSRATFKTLPAHCRIVGDPAAPRSDTRTGAPRHERPPALPTTPEPDAVPATRPAEAKETSGAQAVRLARSGVRWYGSKAADEGLAQVKFVGIPVERIPELVAAATALFPELRQY